MSVPYFTLRRLEHTPYATYGQLFDAEERLVVVTLELSWLDNHRRVSCIPPGIYSAHRRMSDKRKYELFELENVPNRSNIEIHIGNLPTDSEGCILVGSAFGQIKGRPGVINSGDAFRRWMERNKDIDRITLEVVAPVSAAA